jgi:uncharacterized protein (TIGR02246 family)
VVAAENFVRQMIQTFNQHDPKAWAAAYAADAVVVDPQYAEPLRGRDAIEKDISDFFRTFPDMTMEESTVLGTGDQFAVEITRHRYPYGTTGGAKRNHRAHEQIGGLPGCDVRADELRRADHGGATLLRHGWNHGATRPAVSLHPAG